MREIRGDAKNLRALLGNAKYAVDYYQREYRWQTKHITELLDDLTDKFRESYEPGDERSAVEQYGHYFLGSIIVSDKEGRKYLIDGQQRLTTLTLLLIYVYRELTDQELKGSVAELIFSYKHGTRSFNLDVPERTACMEALYAGETLDGSDLPESNRNILARFADIDEQFPDDLAADALPYFVDWLIENVHLVEITAYSDDDAYTIFETMNDRGLSLTPTDMLKGYLLANITDHAKRTAASHVWKERIQALQDLGKEEDADAIKSWLRSQHAETIRERKGGAVPKDFERIGTEFHRWIRDQEAALGLAGSSDFSRLIERDFYFYARQYQRVREAAEDLRAGLECVFYNAQQNFTLQYPLLLSPLRVEDASSDVDRKLRVVASYIDILISRRMWNFRSIDYSTMQYGMFLVMKDIRRKSVPELVTVLSAKLASEPETFATNERFRLHGKNRNQIHRLLARLTDFVGVASGRPSQYVELSRGGKKGFEIEHIWADHPERHQDEFAHPADFDDYRNRLGGLLLLPKSFNASYGDWDYAKKHPHYLKQNLLAQSLCPEAYQRDPGFLRFIESSGLPFQPHTSFEKADLDARHELYQRIAERLWDPARLASDAA